jgi:peptide/nickel transport system substrate-binding protein
MIRRRTAVLAAGAMLVTLAVVGDSSADAKQVAKLQGGTAYFAEGPQASPNYIFPFMSLQFFSVTNIAQFQQLMYRPLYWFGNRSQPTLNLSLSLARRPVYSTSRREVTIDLKPYAFSDGESVTAQDVVFWFNMLKVERFNWASYVPGGMPDDLASVTAPNATTVVVKTTGTVNPLWFTYNELSQITPFPMAWDVSASGQSSGAEACGKAPYASVAVKVEHPESAVNYTIGSGSVVPGSSQARSCAAVYAYLSTQSGYNPASPKAPNDALKTYATNPLWRVVDGPWRLASFDALGNATFVPNPRYSGPVKPKLAKFVELPFTSNSGEFDALASGKLTFGYLPTEDMTPAARKPTVAAANNPRLSNYALTPVYPWGINYFPYNFASTGDNGEAGTILKQLYFRQALQLLVDQPLYIAKIFKGYAVPTYGPVPVFPRTAFATSYEEHNPYAFNVRKAQQLLTVNGWHVVPGGTTTCSDAAKCGVPSGTPLDLTLTYYIGGKPPELLKAEKASWAQAGIQVSFTPPPSCNIIGGCDTCPAAPYCTWELSDWGGGWVYSPDYYPSGEEVFLTGVGSNQGYYSDPVNDANIRATNFSDGTLGTYEDYLAQQLPVLWQPEPAYELAEIKKDLAGATPLNPLLSINPENWYFTK